MAIRLDRRGVNAFNDYWQTGRPEALDAAVTAWRDAVAATPPGHPDLAKYVSNLGGSLCVRFERAGDIADLDAGVDVGRRAVDLTPPGHPNLAWHLSTLGGSLRNQFGRAGDIADLHAAIDAGRRAADLTPPGHPNLAGRLSNLANALRARFRRAGNTADLDAAIDCWRQASDVPAGMPSIRLAAARSWGGAAADAGRICEAAEGYAAAVGLLPTAAWHGLDRATRQKQLARWAGLAADAAACAVLDARPGLAVELLEQGRSVLWAQALNLRSDLTRLAETAPGLAGRLDSIRVILDSPVPEMTPAVPERATGSVPDPVRARQQQDAAELRRRKAREWDEVLAQVRALPGFGHFLAPIPYTELKAVAVAGPVVIVNASRHGSHALIVEAGREQPRVVSLPDLSRDAAAKRANEMLRAAGPGRAFPDRRKTAKPYSTSWTGCGTSSPGQCSLPSGTPAAPGPEARGHGCGGAQPGRWPSCPSTPPATTPARAPPQTEALTACPTG